jgi:hypothetical protein
LTFLGDRGAAGLEHSESDAIDSRKAIWAAEPIRDPAQANMNCGGCEKLE